MCDRNLAIYFVIVLDEVYVMSEQSMYHGHCYFEYLLITLYCRLKRSKINTMSNF